MLLFSVAMLTLPVFLSVLPLAALVFPEQNECREVMTNCQHLEVFTRRSWCSSRGFLPLLLGGCILLMLSPPRCFGQHELIFVCLLFFFNSVSLTFFFHWLPIALFFPSSLLALVLFFPESWGCTPAVTAIDHCHSCVQSGTSGIIPCLHFPTPRRQFNPPRIAAYYYYKLKLNKTTLSKGYLDC